MLWRPLKPARPAPPARRPLARPPRRPRRSRLLLASVGFFLALGGCRSDLLQVPLYILPQPSAVLYQLWRNLPRLAEYTWSPAARPWSAS